MMAAAHVQTPAHRAFSVTVRTPTRRISYHAIGTDSATIATAAIDAYGVCSVSVIAL